MSEQNPIRVFVTHVFSSHPDYHRVFEYLESSSKFFYKNCSAPDKMPATGGKEALKQALLEQIRAAEIAILVSSMYSENRDLIGFQLDAAEATRIPIVALPAFGGTGKVSDEIKARVEEVVDWNERLIVDAVRKHARHEETKRWDVIEFDMS